MILAADTFKTNSDLMLACRELGYISDIDDVLDMTYGRGTWWKKWEPHRLVTNDLDPKSKAESHHDFRDLPGEWEGEFDVVAFDPPYVAVGGRATSTIGNFNDAYGLVTVPKTPADLHIFIVEGLLEAHRVLRKKGVVLFKAMNYVTSGAYNLQAYAAIHAVAREFRVRDEFIHLRKPGPQPSDTKCRTCDGKGVWPQEDGTEPTCKACDGATSFPRPQKHARRNYSHLFVLEKR